VKRERRCPFLAHTSAPIAKADSERYGGVWRKIRRERSISLMCGLGTGAGEWAA
jgi:hypothetical protein